MKSFGFTLVTVALIAALGYGGYYAVRSLKNPSLYVPVDTEKLGDIHSVVTTSEPATVAQTALASTAPTASATVASTASVPATTDLQDGLQAMVTAKTLLKKGSKGASVGYVEQFMNAYFQKSLKIDNDFGSTLLADVKKFQSQNKLSATGQVGKSTVQYMLMWLKNNPQ